MKPEKLSDQLKLFDESLVLGLNTVDAIDVLNRHCPAKGGWTMHTASRELRSRDFRYDSIYQYWYKLPSYELTCKEVTQ